MNPILIKSVNTARRFALVAYGDTSHFSSFVQRTMEDPSAHRAYLLSLYKTSFDYQARTGCFLKLLCDGFLSVHEFETDEPPASAIINVLDQLDRVHSEIKTAIDHLRYPRPDEFRITVTLGHVWALTIESDKPNRCSVVDCDFRTMHDYFGYPTILADRMLELEHRVPLMLCQSVTDFLGNDGGPFEFRRLRPERRVPIGVFREDMESMWEVRRKTT